MKNAEISRLADGKMYWVFTGDDGKLKCKKISWFRASLAVKFILEYIFIIPVIGIVIGFIALLFLIGFFIVKFPVFGILFLIILLILKR